MNDCEHNSGCWGHEINGYLVMRCLKCREPISVAGRSLQQPDAPELDRLRRVEAAALRVASSRRNGIVTDQAPLNALDAALEGRDPAQEREPPHCSTCECGAKQ